MTRRISSVMRAASRAVPTTRGVFVTDGRGRVIFEITQRRVKEVRRGVGFGSKRLPTAEETKILTEFFDP